MANVHRKTPKGLSEIQTRANRLPPRLRSALILVDGKRSDADLAQLILQAPAQVISSLREQGFIELVPGVAPPVVPPFVPPFVPAQVSAPAAPAPLSAPFERRRRDAVRALTDLVGPIGEDLAIRMERAKDETELRPLLTIALRVIGNTRGDQAASRYGTRFDAG